MNITIRLAEERDLEAMRLLRNANSWAYFNTEQVSAEQQRAWWEGRDKTTLWFVGEMSCDATCVSRFPPQGYCSLCNGTGSRHCWQFSLSADGVLGNLAVANWCKGKGVAKRCVARVLVPGQRYWGLFRVDNPSILRFWPSVVHGLEPTDDPPPGRGRGEHCPGSVQWVDFLWTIDNAAWHGVKPWYVEHARSLAEKYHRNVHFSSKVVEKVAPLGMDYEATAWFCDGAPLDVTEFPGLPKPVTDAVLLLTKGEKETWLDHVLRIKRLSYDGVAKTIKAVVLEQLMIGYGTSQERELWRMAWHLLERT